MSTFDELHLYHDSEPRSAAMNMAIDEALLGFSKAPSLRFYQWRQPSLSFGYFGRFADAAKYRPEREIVRRWTGGGLVLHGSDLTYALVVPSTHRFSTESSQIVYATLHEAMQRVLQAARVDATLATSFSPRNGDECFLNPVAADVMVNGEKIAGAGQRRSRWGLLLQGSIQHVVLPRNFADRFAADLGQHVRIMEVASETTGRAEEITRQKYGTAAWTQRR